MSGDQVLDVLFFAEDPGAANLIAPLPARLGSAGISSLLLADPALGSYLDDRMIDFRLLDDQPGDMLDALAPRLLATGTSENRDGSSLALIDNARTRGIMSLGLVDMLSNAERRFQGCGSDPLAHAPDWLAVTDAPTARAYEALGFPEDRIAVCGHPHFDVVRDRRREFSAKSRQAMRRELFRDAEAERPILMFLAEGIDRLNPNASRATEAYTLHGSGLSNDRTTIVLEEVLAAAEHLDPKPYVVLRLHPKNAAADYDGLRNGIDMVSHGGDPLPLLWCADLVVGMTTFLLVEAALLGVSTLSVVPRIEETAWLPAIGECAMPVVTTSCALRSELCRLFDDAGTGDLPDVLPSGASQSYVSLIASLLTGADDCARCS